MTRRFALPALAALACAAVTAPPAAAEWWLSPGTRSTLEAGNFYIDGSALFGSMNFPRVNSLARFNVFNLAPLPQANLDFGHVSYWGGGAAFGYILRDGTLPAWLGARVRLELSGQGWTGRGEATDSFAASPVAFYNFIGVNGRNNPIIPVIALIGDTTRMTVASSGFSLALRARSDFRVSENIVLTPSFGIFGGETRDRYRQDTQYILVPNLLQFPQSVDARLNTRRIGGELGLTAKYEATQFLTFALGARIGLAHVQARLSANDCFTIFAVSPGTNCETAAAVIPVIATFTSLNATRSGLGFQAGGSVSASYDLSWAVVTLGGGIGYDSKYASYVGPTSSTLLFAPNAQATPAGIRFSGVVRYNAFINLRVPFGM